MAAKWRRIVVESDPDVMVVEAGAAYEGMRITVPDEVVAQIRAGYQCVRCLEPLDTAFPESCPLCLFPMKDKQAEVFADVFAGHRPGVRTGADWEAEADRLEEIKERRAFERRAAESNIVVPRSLGSV